MSDIKWGDLQEKIKFIFSTSQVKHFDDKIDDDVNGYNWILSFQELRNEMTIILHTKLIFKIDKDKKYLRKNEFLYLYDLNCKYRIVKFDSLTDLENIIFRIMRDNTFSDDMVSLSEFLIEPEIIINEYFRKEEIDGITIFELRYIPSNLMNCNDMELLFKGNINNSTDFNLTIKKDKDFIITLTYEGSTYNKTIKDLSDLSNSIGSLFKKITV